MKNYRAILNAVAAVLLTCTAGLAAAGGTQTLNTTATVTAACKFTSGTAITLPFGNVDPSAAGPLTATANVPFSCTKGTADAAVTYTGGTTLTGPAGATMAYTLSTITLPAATGFSAAQTFPVQGNLLAASYQNAVAGAYTDTVVLTINH